MTMRTATRALTAVLLAAGTGLLPTATATATAAGPTEELVGFADGTLDAVDPRTGRTVHGVFGVFAPQGAAPFGRTEFFVGDDGGIAWECTTGGSVPAGLEGTGSAWAAGVLAMTCGAPGQPERRGYALVGLHWQGRGEVSVETFVREDCTETMEIRQARVDGGVLLVVPGVAVTPVLPHDDPNDTLRRQRIVCG